MAAESDVREGIGERADGRRMTRLQTGLPLRRRLFPEKAGRAISTGSRKDVSVYGRKRGIGRGI
jgi:hypothetical protein